LPRGYGSSRLTLPPLAGAPPPGAGRVLEQRAFGAPRPPVSHPPGRPSTRAAAARNRGAETPY